MPAPANGNRPAGEAPGRARAELGERLETLPATPANANEFIDPLATNLEERLRFEKLLAGISARFVNLPADRIDSEVADAQRRICELLCLDRSTLFQATEGESGFFLTHLHNSSGNVSRPERVEATEFFPWTARRALDGETVIIEKMSNLPPEADRDRENYHTYGTRSVVVVPLSVGEGPVLGMLTFAVTLKERRWTETAVMGFQLLAQVLANAFARRRAEEILNNRFRFEQMVADLSARLMAAPPGGIDREIQTGLRQILVFFQVERCALLEFQKDRRLSRITHAVFGEGIEPISGEINLAGLFPWCYEKLMRGEPLNLQGVDDYPADADRDRQSHEAMGIKSALNIPISVYGPVSRTIVLNTTRRNLAWPDAFIPRLRVLGEIFAGALERRESRLQLEDQLRFETLLAELSGRFINLPAGRVDSEIIDAQRRVCECLGVDLSALWQWSGESPRLLTLTHLYRPQEVPPTPDPMVAHDYFPWCQQQIEAGRIVAVSSLEELPADAARDREVWRQFGVKTSLTIPLSPGGGPSIGALSFNTVQQERTWPEPLINRLQLVAQMFTNALVRKQKEMALRESEARLSVTTDAAGAGLWIMDIHTQRVWASPKSRELFHFPSDEEIRYDSYFRVIHPDDRDRVHQAVQDAVRSGEDFHCDYRIALPDGGNRWICSRGQRHHGSADESERLVGVSFDITDRVRMEEQLTAQLQEIEALKQRLEQENIYLREEVKLLVEQTDIVGQSTAMRRILSQAEQVAGTDSTVLLLGETGTGKELLARAIHNLSARKDRPLVTVNCASLPPTLIESELFGREKGAYTGALTRMVGRFELADKSTLFLDEIGELPLELQGKLLRVLEEGVFERLGSPKPVRVDVRIIAATNRDIGQDVKDGRFRRDLFYRLNVFPLVIPPLRERPEDIPSLVRAIIRELQKRMGKEIESIPKKTMDALQAYSWPGNVRELRNLIEHAMILSRGKTLDIQLPTGASARTAASGNLQDMERTHLTAVLEKTGWRIAGPGGAAEILGLKRTTLQAKMKKLGIRRSNKTMPT